MIKPGSLVNVSFASGSSLVWHKVIHIPSATGDCYILENEMGVEVRVMMFEVMQEVK